MYSPVQLAFKYIDYFFRADNGKGHGVHSPFVFDFIIHVLNGAKNKEVYHTIESVRQQLKKNNATIEVEDFGAGSRVIPTRQRKVKDIARTSLKPQKYSQLLHRMVQYYQPSTILEVGTSLGITTAYLATGNSAAQVITMEGSNAIARIASANFDGMHIANIMTVLGNFDTTLSATLQNIPSVDFAFIDGNHRYEPTIRYFEQVLAKSHDRTIIILDDIYWSKEMEQAWEWVKTHPAVRLTIDLFAIGIVILRPEILHRQHFTVRY